MDCSCKDSGTKSGGFIDRPGHEARPFFRKAQISAWAARPTGASGRLNDQRTAPYVGTAFVPRTRQGLESTRGNLCLMNW
jgi:hypothetical protein